MYDLQIEFPEPPVPAGPDVRAGRADRGRRPGPHAAIRGRPRRSRRRSRSRGGGGGRRLLPQLLRQPGQRAGGGAAPAAAARRPGVHLGRGLAPDPRVPPDDHDGVQRGHDARHRALPGRAAEVAGGGGLRRFGADDALQRRRGLGRRRGPGADPPRRVRAGRGCAGRLVVRPAARRAPPAVLRHGRNDGQVLPHQGLRARAHDHVRGGPHLPVQEGFGLPGLRALGRPGRDRGRRRQPRPSRRAGPAEGRPGVVGRRPRARQLRPRRHAAGGDRRRRAPGVARPRLLPRRRHAPRRGPSREGHGTAGRRARPARGRHGCGRARRRQPEHGRGLPHARRGAGGRPAGRRRSSPSAAPGPCTRAGWPSCSTPTG